eukprot:comp16720_c0_seq1/m.15012 comp16720_c0_seq1/g.15012  ORF comp16720_c0_seq1/g.15012 comp16720_c0_seq1/m.15012 type:complete len:423 (-) comp16720_c0_seq1:17-1285(-)
MSHEYADDVLDERLTNEEYKIWKKNTPFLYDLMYACALDWPSLTIQFQPTVTDYEGKAYRDHYLLLGTQCETEPNFLINARLRLPRCEYIPDPQSQDYGSFKGPEERLNVDYQKIPHDGEVNRARSMPQNEKIVATRGPKAEVNIFDLDRQPKIPNPDGVSSPEMRLEGHTKEGYGIAWNVAKEGLLASGGEDGVVCVWNVSSGQSAPLVRFPDAYPRLVDDVAWSPHHGDILASVGDNGNLCFWDMRKATQQTTIAAHSAEATCVAFNPFEDFLICTASVDKTVALWDLRNMKTKMHVLQGHSDEVYQVHWSPHNSTVLGSSGADRRVMVWDLSRIGLPLTKEEALDGPPELLFVHGGHTCKVGDFSWCPFEPWVIGSVAGNNLLQVWQMAENIYAEPANPPPPAPAAATAPVGGPIPMQS